MKQFWTVLAAFLVLIGCAGSALAKAEPEFVHGYTIGHAYIRNQWTKVIINLENKGDDPAMLRSVLVVDKGLTKVDYEKKVYLPANCERTAWFYAQLGAKQNYDMELRLADGRKVHGGGEWSNVLNWGRLLVLTMDEERLVPSMNLYLGRREAYGGKYRPTRGKEEKTKIPGMGAWSMQGLVRRPATMGTRLRVFPDHWAGLDSMSAATMGQLDHTRWRPSQVEALRTWVKSGGVVLMFPGAEYHSLIESRLEPLLPVRIFNSRKQKRLFLSGEDGQWEVDLDDYVDVLEMEATDGEVLLWQGDLPMVVERRVGMGAIYMFAFPGKAMDQWEGRRTFLPRVLRDHERLKPLSQSGLLQKGPNMLDDVAGAQVAPPSFVVATLGTYFVISALALLIAYIRGRSELAWAVIIPVGIVIGLISYRMGRKYREEVGLSINEIAVVSTRSGSPTAFRSAVLGVHAEDTIHGLELQADKRQDLITTSTTKRETTGKFDRYFISTNPTFVVRKLKLISGDFPKFVVDSVVDLQGSVNADVRLGPDGVTGTVTNNSTVALKSCLCAVNSYPFIVGDLPPGESREVRLSDAKMKAKGDFSTEILLGSRSRTRKEIVRQMFTPSRKRAYSPWAQRLFLIGWAGEEGFVSEHLQGIKEEDITRRSVGLLCVEAEVKPAPAGSRVTVPRAFSTAAVRPSAAIVQKKDTHRTAFALTDFIGEAMAPKADLLFYIPRFASNVRMERAEIQLGLKAYGKELIVRGVNPESGERTELARLGNPVGTRTIVVEDAGNYQDRDLGIMNFELETRAIVKPKPQAPGKGNGKGKGKKPGPVAVPGGSGGWSLREASVALEGKAD